MRATRLRADHTYRIGHSGKDGRVPREIEFEATDAAAAWMELQAIIPEEQPIIVKEDGRTLATVQLALEGFWSVSKSPDRTRG